MAHRPTKTRLCLRICVWLVAVCCGCAVILGLYSLFFSYPKALSLLFLVLALPPAILGVLVALIVMRRSSRSAHPGTIAALAACILEVLALAMSVLPRATSYHAHTILAGLAFICTATAVIGWGRPPTTDRRDESHPQTASATTTGSPSS